MYKWLSVATNIIAQVFRKIGSTWGCHQLNILFLLVLLAEGCAFQRQLHTCLCVIVCIILYPHNADIAALRGVVCVLSPQTWVDFCDCLGQEDAAECCTILRLSQKAKCGFYWPSSWNTWTWNGWTTCMLFWLRVPASPPACYQHLWSDTWSNAFAGLNYESSSCLPCLVEQKLSHLQCVLCKFVTNRSW